jgi:hypothetical protein
MYEPLKRTPGEMITVAKDPHVPNRRSQTGEYDTTILCAECDNTFSPWDDYACDLLLRPIPVSGVVTGPSGQRFYLLSEWSYVDLKLFFLSVLWRMSVSHRPAFAKVNLGPYEAAIRTMLKAKNPGSADDFAIFAYRYEDYVGQNSMIETRPERINGVRVYSMGLPGYIVTIKVDQKPIPIVKGPLVLSPDQPLAIGLRNATAAPEARHFRKIAQGQTQRERLALQRRTNKRR